MSRHLQPQPQAIAADNSLSLCSESHLKPEATLQQVALIQGSLSILIPLTVEAQIIDADRVNNANHQRIQRA